MMELSHAPLTPWSPGRLPGMAPIGFSAWLNRDEAFPAQMAYRDRLIAERPEIVLAEERSEGAEELLDLVLSTLGAHDPRYEIGADEVRRPDGVTVPLDREQPFATMGRLAQEDLLLLRKPRGAAEHVLVGAVLCFPSRWSLREKMNRPLVAIHERVPAYDDSLAPRVQRLFDALSPDRPLARANWLVHSDPEPHQPRRFATMEKRQEPTGRFWLRVERQCILKLAVSGDAVFSVKTFITPIEALTPDQRSGLIDALAGQGDAMRDYHGGVAHNDAAIERLRAL